MNILSYKPGHDGHIVYISGEKLVFSIESEKDSWPRYEVITPSLNLKCLQYVDEIPDVVAISGWVKGLHSSGSSVEGGYYGLEPDTIIDRKQKFLGKDVNFFSSSHERSHLLCAYGLSPYSQGKPCYALVWEGNIGSFYRIDENVNIKKIGNVLEDPGNKYAFLYALADPTFPFGKGKFRFENAGKLMALASYGKSGIPNKKQQTLIDNIMIKSSIVLSVDKRDFEDSGYLNIGVESDEFKDIARKFSDELFEKFHIFAQQNLKEGLPLLISGGCGLNCDWNSAWKHSGLFEDVFIPPCTNDSGSAIGTAIDAMHHYTGKAKITWSVYAGEDFVKDIADMTNIEIKTLDMSEVANFLLAGNVIAWVQGKYEIGPRALGNRSLLAMPFTKEMHARLNKIKKREGFRPIAPICLEEEIERCFDSQEPSPYMLHFQKVRTEALPAITHVDGSARLQSVNFDQNPAMYNLLSAFKHISGYGVLCNTSLNFNGTGFINRMSDLVKYAKENHLNGFVVNNLFYKIQHK